MASYGRGFRFRRRQLAVCEMMYSRMWCDIRKRLNACIEPYSHTDKHVDEKATHCARYESVGWQN